MTVGLVKVPYNEMRKYGSSGAVSGISKGVAGLATKPIVGVLDAVTHTGDAVREVFKTTNKSKKLQPLYRVRLSALFGPDGRLLPFDRSNAAGAFILNILRQRDSYTISNVPVVESHMTLNEVAVSSESKPILPPASSNLIRGNWLSMKIFGSPRDIAANSSLRVHRDSLDDVDMYAMDPVDDMKQSGMSLRTRENIDYNAANDTSYGNTIQRQESDTSVTSAKPLAASKRNLLMGTMQKKSWMISRRSLKNNETKDDSMPSTLKTSKSMQSLLSPNSTVSSVNKSPPLDVLAYEISEHVIHTTIMNEAPGIDIVIIVTTIRIVIAHYIRKSNRSASVKELWEANLSSLANPEFDDRSNGKMTITFSMKGNNYRENTLFGRRNDDSNDMPYSQSQRVFLSTSFASRVNGLGRLSNINIADPSSLTQPLSSSPYTSFTLKADTEFEVRDET